MACICLHVACAIACSAAHDLLVSIVCSDHGLTGLSSQLNPLRASSFTASEECTDARPLDSSADADNLCNRSCRSCHLGQPTTCAAAASPPHPCLPPAACWLRHILPPLTRALLLRSSPSPLRGDGKCAITITFNNERAYLRLCSHEHV